jgi:hypothetical protein
MDRQRIRRVTRNFEIWLGAFCALYLGIVAGTALLLNHAQALHLDQRHIARIWLPMSYALDEGYDVPVDAVVRDLNTALLSGATGARILDLTALLWVAVLIIELALKIAQSSEPKPTLATRYAPELFPTRPLSKAAPYGEVGRPTTRGKVIPFSRR